MQDTISIENFSKDNYRITKKNKNWSSLELFRDLNDSVIKLSKVEKNKFEPMFWHSICTEHDARHFYRYLATKNFLPSIDLEIFLNAWLEDEINHTNGFKKLYSLIYDSSDDMINKKLASRTIDFSEIDEFFNDELSIGLLIAYDELITTHVYNLSIPFYDSLNHPHLSKWIRHLKYDEANHFIKIIKVIKQLDCTRAESILYRIMQVDLAMKNYNGTFVLDHACPEFPLTNKDIEAICHHILKKLK